MIMTKEEGANLTNTSYTAINRYVRKCAKKYDTIILYAFHNENDLILQFEKAV